MRLSESVTFGTNDGVSVSQLTKLGVQVGASLLSFDELRFTFTELNSDGIEFHELLSQHSTFIGQDTDISFVLVTFLNVDVDLDIKVLAFFRHG